MGVRCSTKHQWKYMHGMVPDEIVLIKWFVRSLSTFIFQVLISVSANSFDSVQDGSVAVFTPHTGFEDASTPKGTPPRESIELRALVFYD